ncbi:MAG: hypothetical protein M1823_003803 [Watsoniomyces obsoletus]|nr:MAG: hypothetical protein M1823_003803 [Watsoniomyces obsoletus]
MGNNKKRKRKSSEAVSLGVGGTLAAIEQSKVPAVAMTISEEDSDGGSPVAYDMPGDGPKSLPEQEWTGVLSNPAKKRRKIPKKDSSKYPSITRSSNSRLQWSIKVSDLRDLVLYILGDGVSPQWVSVRQHVAIRRVVVLMVSGLEQEMFDKISTLDADVDSTNQKPCEAKLKENKELKTTKNGPLSGKTSISDSDDIHPMELSKDALQDPLKPLADIFPHVWPVLAPGDDRYSHMRSPITAMLMSPLPKSKEEKSTREKMDGGIPDWQDRPVSVSQLLATVEQLRENDFAIHPALLDSEDEKRAEAVRRRAIRDPSYGEWIDSRVSSIKKPEALGPEELPKDATAGRKILAIDCEMCKTSIGELALTRIGVVNWDGDVVMDELVKPDLPIVDYLTAYSGIDAEMLKPVQTRLTDIQSRLLDICDDDTIIIGHSLNADFAAIGITHPYIIDTSILYPHPRGPPLKSGLKWLTQKYLAREIQKGHGSTGHSPVEDARACLDLVKQKCRKGLQWGTRETTTESIFKRIGRCIPPTKYANRVFTDDGRLGAVVDWGRPEKGVGAAARVCIGCEDDDGVVEGIKRALSGDADGQHVPAGGVDFVWGRLQELGFAQGWYKPPEREGVTDQLGPEEVDRNGNDRKESDTQPHDPEHVSKILTQTVRRIVKIYESLPPCTAFMVYSGSSDPREMSRLQGMHQQFKREYQIKKWDELSVQWTDVEEQQLREATKRARRGLGMVVVK